MATLTLGTISPGKTSLFSVGATSKQDNVLFTYKFKKGKWTIKGKWEGSDSSKRDYFKSKIETELRYTFGD